jgi:transcriptional regulator with XRE-family HTH domain
MDYKTVKQVIGANIRLKRRRLGLSLNALGHKIGVSYQQIQKYEKGFNAPPCDKLIQLAQIFQCSVDTLIRQDDSSNLLPKSVSEFSHIEDISTLVFYFSRIPQEHVRNSLCVFMKSIADLASLPQDETLMGLHHPTPVTHSVLY